MRARQNPHEIISISNLRSMRPEDDLLDKMKSTGFESPMSNNYANRYRSNSNAFSRKSGRAEVKPNEIKNTKRDVIRFKFKRDRYIKFKKMINKVEKINSKCKGYIHVLI